MLKLLHLYVKIKTSQQVLSERILLWRRARKGRRSRTVYQLRWSVPCVRARESDPIARRKVRGDMTATRGRKSTKTNFPLNRKTAAMLRSFLFNKNFDICYSAQFILPNNLFANLIGFLEANFKFRFVAIIIFVNDINRFTVHDSVHGNVIDHFLVSLDVVLH